MSTEAQKKASRKYRLNHKQYYSKKSGEHIKKIREERNKYKKELELIEYIIDSSAYYYGYQIKAEIEKELAKM